MGNRCCLGGLPPELVLLVREALLEQSSFTEFLDLGWVCKDWHKWVREDKTLSAWVQQQPLDVSLCLFRMTRAALSYIQDHVHGKWTVSLSV